MHACREVAACRLQGRIQPCHPCCAPACLHTHACVRAWMGCILICCALLLFHGINHCRSCMHGVQPQEVIETPATGCLHPAHRGYFATPAEYMRWYEREGPVRDPAAPTGACDMWVAGVGQPSFFHAAMRCDLRSTTAAPCKQMRRRGGASLRSASSCWHVGCTSGPAVLHCHCTAVLKLCCSWHLAVPQACHHRAAVHQPAD